MDSYPIRRKHKYRNRLVASTASLLFVAAIAPAALHAQYLTFTGAQVPVADGGVGVALPVGVAMDAAGDIFIANTGKGTVLKIPASGSPGPVGSGLARPAGVASDAAGNLFIADTGNNRVVRISVSGAQTVVASGLKQPAGVAVDASGNLWIADTANNRVLEISAAGGQTVVATGLNQPAGVAVDGAGNVFIADTNNNRVLEVAGSVQSVVASGLSLPQSVAADAAGNLYIADSSNNRVLKRAPDGSQSTLGYGLVKPEGVAVNAAGNVFISDTDNNRVVVLNSGMFGNVNVCPAGETNPAPCSQTMTLMYHVDGSFAMGTPSVVTEGSPNLDFTPANGSTCAGNLTAGSTCIINVSFAPRFAGLRRGGVQLNGVPGDNSTTLVGGVGVAPQIAFGPGVQSTVYTNAKSGFVFPSAIAVDSAGNIYLVDRSQSQVLKISPDGSQNVIFSQAAAVAVDGAGTLYIATGSYTIYKILPNGYQTVMWGFSAGNGLAVDGLGNLYVADQNLSELIKVSPTGEQTVIATPNIPSSVAVDAAGNVFYTVPGAVVKLPAGGGSPISMQFGAYPHSVAVDAAGNLFVGDGYTGDLQELPAGADTPITLGQFYALQGAVVDAAGNLFVLTPDTVYEFQRGQPPTLSFAATEVGLTSTDSPQSITIESIGNAPLTVSNLAIGANFAQIPGPGAPADCAASFSLQPGGRCNLSVNFTPATVGPIQSSATLTDHALNAASGSQQILLTGTGQAASQTISFDPIANAPLGAVVSLSASASSGLPVAFSSLTNSVCTVSGATATLIDYGICTVQASQAGNALYTAAAPVRQSFTTLKSQTITFPPLKAQVVGASLPLTATAESSLPVTFTSLTPNVCSVAGTTATMVAAGTCTIQASQSGSSLYTAATPVTQSFAVNLNSQTITFTGLPATATFGSAGPYPLNATASSGLPVSYAVTGSATISGSTLTITGAGTVTVTASQAGNASYAAATPVSLTIAVSAASQTITFTGLPATATFGSAGPYALNATASSSLAVSYAVTGPATISGSTLTITGAGTVTVTASQPGNTNYAAATPVSLTIAVSAASQTITFTGLPATAPFGSAGPYSLGATSSSGLPVSYAVTGPATISGSTLTITGAGTVTVTASQAGNASYAAATPVSRTITVSAASQTITFTGLPATATFGSAGPYTLNATSSSGLPVSYAVTGPATISGSTLTITGAGTVTVTASQPGNASYAAATPVSRTITVSAASQTITFTGLPATAAFGSAGPYTLNATSSSGLPVSYAVTGPATISGSTLNLTGAGTVTVTASQPGNASYAPATPVSRTITVSATSQTITFNPIPAQVAGGSISLSASASSGLAVSFTSLSTAVCTVSGSTATMLASGTCSIRAAQAGNSQYAAATPVTQNFAVNAAGGFTITPIPASETVYRGNRIGGYALQLRSVNGFKGDVRVSCAGGPSSSICLDFPQTVHVNGTEYAFTGILFPANTTPGTYTITFTGTSGPVTSTATAQFTVKK